MQYLGVCSPLSSAMGFSLPKPICGGMNLNLGDKITIVVEDDRICIKKAQSNKD